MHELRVASQIFEIAEEIMRQEALVSVDDVRVRIGELSGINASALRFSWQALTSDTRLDHTALEIEVVPITARCRDCHREFVVVDLPFRCSHCTSVKIEIVQGQEIEIVSVTVTDPESK